jgi:hypothetical protein
MRDIADHDRQREEDKERADKPESSLARQPVPEITHRLQLPSTGRSTPHAAEEGEKRPSLQVKATLRYKIYRLPTRTQIGELKVMPMCKKQ